MNKRFERRPPMKLSKVSFDSALLLTPHTQFISKFFSLQLHHYNPSSYYHRFSAFYHNSLPLNLLASDLPLFISPAHWSQAELYETCHHHSWIAACVIPRTENQVPRPSRAYKTSRSLAPYPPGWALSPTVTNTVSISLTCTCSFLSQSPETSYLKSSTALDPSFPFSLVFF